MDDDDDGCVVSVIPLPVKDLGFPTIHRTVVLSWIVRRFLLDGDGTVDFAILFDGDDYGC